MAHTHSTDAGYLRDQRSHAQSGPRLPGSVRSRPKLMIVLGAISVALGLVAIIFPFIAALATNLLVGSVMAAAGLVSITHAVKLRGAEGWGVELLGGILALAIGLLLLLFPLPGILSLGLLLVAFFFTQGAVRLVTALRHRQEPGWAWLLGVALLEILLGIVVLTGFPGSAIWLLGVLLGVDLLFNGVGLIMFARSIRRGRPAPAR